VICSRNIFCHASLKSLHIIIAITIVSKCIFMYVYALSVEGVMLVAYHKMFIL